MNNGTARQVIRNSVVRFRGRYTSTDHVYYSCLAKMKAISLGSITRDDVEKIVDPFLIKWGGMGRVLNSDDYSGWEEELTQQIRANHDLLQSFRVRDMTQENTPDTRSKVMQCYNATYKAVGRVAAAKVLHLICPDFFPLWDTDIAKAVKSELRDTDKIRKGQKILTQEGYFEFMVALQCLYTKYHAVFLALASEHNAGKLKIIDEYLWWSAHRPLGLVW